MSACCDDAGHAQPSADDRYRRVLWAALGINAAMFAVELVASFLAGSVAVQADALDFLGDAGNYAVSLLVLGMAVAWRARAALLKGTVMGLFGLWVLFNTANAVIAGTIPHADVMGAIGLLALAANVFVAFLLYRYRNDDANRLSVWLCSRNDAIANIAVILAGAGVWATDTSWPDIAVAAAIAALGLSSAARILHAAVLELRAGTATGARLATEARRI
jgi:Co/Zn/Cd efflux system component